MREQQKPNGRPPNTPMKGGPLSLYQRQRAISRKDLQMATKTKDGRKQITFMFSGKRYYCYGRTLKEAEEKAREKRRNLEEGRYKKGKELSLDEYHERWAAARYGTVREATIRKQSFEYAAAANIIIDSAGTRFGDLKITEIEVQNIRDLQRGLQKQIPPKYKQTRNTNGINGIMALIKHILNDAVNERIIDFNPARAVKPLKRTEKEARETNHRALTHEETRAFFEAAAGSWYYDAFRFMIYSGCRCGEVGALTTADISGDRIMICRTLTKNDCGVYVVGDTAKTKKGVREIPLTDDLREVIEHQKAINRMINGEKVIGFNEHLFTSPRGNLINVASLNKELGRIARKAGIEHFTAHAFRDTFATRAIESGMKPKTLQEILGHANIGITMNLYAHVMEETKVKEMRAVRVVI